jgi:choline-sulfatase
MRAALAEHIRATEDPFEELEHVADARWRSHDPGYANHRGPAAPQV